MGSSAASTVDQQLASLAAAAVWGTFQLANVLIVVTVALILVGTLAIYLLAEPVCSKGMLYAVVARNHHIKLARILPELKVV